MQGVYQQLGDVILVRNDNAAVMTSTLPANTYVVKNTMEHGLILQKTNDFEVPERVYGNTTTLTQRILNTFADRRGNTGVLLQGQKGSGKTMLAKNIALQGRMLHQYPTILINEPFAGSQFNQFIQNISQPAVLIFDEFEKVYGSDGEDTTPAQESVLTLLDGVVATKKLFIFTINDPRRLDRHMINRPGRVFYNIKYNNLDVAAIVEYCEENLNDKTKLPEITRIASITRGFNFDTIKALVEELNRYNENVRDALQYLNIVLDEDTGSNIYSAQITYCGQEVEYIIPVNNFRETSYADRNHTIRCSVLQPFTVALAINPSTKEFLLTTKSVSNFDDLDDGRERDDVNFEFNLSNLVDFNDSFYIFEKDGLKIKFEQTFARTSWLF